MSLFLRWYSLKGRPGKKGPDEKYRGEIEAKITFIVQSKSSSEVNLTRIGRDKRLGSLKSLQNIGEGGCSVCGDNDRVRWVFYLSCDRSMNNLNRVNGIEYS